MSNPRPRILIAESDRFIRESLCIGLGETFEYLTAANGVQALEIFHKSCAEAVVLDQAQGVVDAVEVCRAIRSSKGGDSIPIYILGEEDDDTICADSFEAGANDYLIKPLHLGVFSRRIHSDIRVASRVTVSEVSAQEKAQVESELFHKYPEPVLLIGAQGVVMLANQAYERVFDSRSLVTGRLFGDIVNGVDFARASGSQESYAELVSNARGVVSVRIVPMRLTKGPWRDCVAMLFTERDSVEPVPRDVSAPGIRTNILVLEDYDVVARSVRRLLERAGHEVSVAASFDEACKAVSQMAASGGAYGLAILDVSIPGSAGGGDVLRALRGIQPELPAIVTSGAWNDPAMSRPAEFGFDAVLRKPFSREELMGVVNKVLAKKIS